MEIFMIDDSEFEDESFEIIENRTPEIIAYEELYQKLENQFRPVYELGIDRTDYIKLFFINILGCEEKNFPNSYYSILNDDNRELYNRLTNDLLYHMRYTFGISFDTENDNFFELLYNFYYFLIVDTKSFILDYLWYYHIYVDGYDINEFYKRKKIQSKLVLNDLFKENPVESINSQLDLYYKQKKENKEIDTNIGNLTYEDRFDTFIAYAKEIFDINNNFNMYTVFEKVNEMSPCDNYNMIINEIELYNAVRFEDDELIIGEIMKRNFDVNTQRDYINKELIDKFFMYLANLQVTLNNSLS